MHSFFKISAFTLLFSKVFATPFIPYDPLPGTISVEADWIYFSPNSESTYYAQESEALPPNMFLINAQGTKFANRFDQFYSGYRLGAGYTFLSFPQILTLTWTDLKAHHSSTALNAIPLSITKFITFPSTDAHPISYSRHFHYYSLDGVFVQELMRNTLCTFQAFGGVQYAKLSAKDHSDVNPTDTNPQSVKSILINEFWGIGPEVGFNGEFPLFCGLSFIGNGHATLLIGKNRSDNEVTTFNSNVFVPTIVSTFNNERIWRLVPELNLQLALAYNFSLPCFQDCGINGCLKIGYEGIVYFNALSDLFIVSSTISTNDYRNVTMHGLVLGLGVNF